MADDEKTCPQCAESVKAAAKICKHCGYDFESGAPGGKVVLAPPVAKKGNGGLIGCLVLVVLVIIIVAMVGGGENASGPATSSAPQPAPTAVTAPPLSNAARSAQQYLKMSGFSRKGLIQQLSSDAGDGYNVSDATAAVDSLNVDWKVQAVRSARQYLEMSGFSCRGLIQQLSSRAGDNYTAAEATYGANEAGAC